MLDKDFSKQKAALEPVQPDERIPALDVVRGFALLGVLIAYAMWNLGNPSTETYSLADKILDFVLTFFVDNKAYTLFATLFGLGFAIQMRRAEARGGNFAQVYRRRLFALVGIGLAHALLLRNGDILVPYAMMGFILLLFRRASNRMLAFGAIAALLFPFLAQSVWQIIGIPMPQRPEAAGLGYFRENIAWVRYWYSTAILFWTPSLTLFLFGLYLGRRFFENSVVSRKGLRRVLVAGFIVGILAFAAVTVLPNLPKFSGQAIAARLLYSFHAWSLAAFYAASLLLLLQKQSWQKRLAPLGTVGRMALTNYLLQAIIIVPVCLVFGLFDKVTPTIGLLLASGVWIFQVPASVWWLKRFRFGPAEWLWRSLTYGSLQPFRLDEQESEISAVKAAI
jgi:uncharacterized protein